VRRNTWSRERQHSLLSELLGFWKEDIWDMRTSPLQTQISKTTKQRRLHFGCKSATINNELKYACWKKFSDGDWRNTQELGRVHRMVKWLNSLGPLPASLMIRPFAEWRARYTTYLKERGMYRQSSRLNVLLLANRCVLGIAAASGARKSGMTSRSTALIGKITIPQSHSRLRTRTAASSDDELSKLMAAGRESTDESSFSAAMKRKSTYEEYPTVRCALPLFSRTTADTVRSKS
jgi:hypothetical protein